MKTFKTPKGTELPFLNLKGKDYLQVAHRLVWFREDHPNWSIGTHIMETNERFTIAQVVIKNESGFLISMAHKKETIEDFKDHLEKSETAALGRALAMAGYGTQFAQELEEDHRIVDAPLPPRSYSPSVAPKPSAPPQTSIKEVLGHIEAVGMAKPKPDAAEKRRRALMDATLRYHLNQTEVVAMLLANYKTSKAEELTDEQVADVIVRMGDSARMGK